MRIAHFLVGHCNPDSANGVEKTVYHLSKHQAALGHTVVLFSLTDKSAVPIPGVEIKTYLPAWFIFMLPKALFTDLLAWQPDIVHLHSAYVPWNAHLSRWLQRKRIAYVSTPHGGLSPYVLRRRWYLKRPYRLFFELPIQNHAAFVHALSAAEAAHIKRYGVHSAIAIAPNGIDIDALCPEPRKEYLKSLYPQIEGKRIFLFLGRLDPTSKGLDLLLRGIKAAQAKDSVLILVGPDSKGKRRELAELAQELHIDSQVIFSDPVYGTDKFDLLAGADVFIHTSRSEGLPFSVLEAAASKLPCLLTPVADPNGLLGQHQAAIIVEPDPASIAAGIQQFMTIDNSALRAMGERAYQVVKDKFNWQHIARTVTDAYQKYAG